MKGLKFIYSRFMKETSGLSSRIEQFERKGRIVPIIEEYGSGLPVVTFVACMHGNEKAGIEILERLREQLIIQGTMRLVVANPKAVIMSKRFVEQDLNRCFPGKIDGKFEEQLARQLRRQLSNSDFLVDLHSTTAQTPPFIITRQYQRLVKDLIEAAGIKKVVIRPRSGVALIDWVKVGIGIELGPHDAPQTLEDGFSAVINVLSTLNMIKKKKDRINEEAIECFKAEVVLPMPSRFEARPEGIHNFQMIEKGSAVGISDGVEIVVEKDFYPILYGEVSYQDTLCWVGEKL